MPFCKRTEMWSIINSINISRYLWLMILPYLQNFPSLEETSVSENGRNIPDPDVIKYFQQLRVSFQGYCSVQDIDITQKWLLCSRSIYLWPEFSRKLSFNKRWYHWNTRQLTSSNSVSGNELRKLLVCSVTVIFGTVKYSTVGSCAICCDLYLWGRVFITDACQGKHQKLDGCEWQ